MDSRDVQVMIGATQIDIRNIDKEIFELQQAIKIKQAELDHSDDNHSSEGEENTTAGRETTGASGDTMNVTLETIKPANNTSFMQLEVDLSFD